MEAKPNFGYVDTAAANLHGKFWPNFSLEKCEIGLLAKSSALGPTPMKSDWN
jgi:hypothetical protein